jgi:hypothetical protein
MRRPPLYNWWQLVLIGGMCSASICSVGFDGSFIDSVMCIPLGGMLVGIQLLSVRNELYSNIFECVSSFGWIGCLLLMHGDRITVATLLSFLAAALAATHRFCYSAVASSSVVLILPVRKNSASFNFFLTLRRASSCCAARWRYHPGTSSPAPFGYATRSCILCSSASDWRSARKCMRRCSPRPLLGLKITLAERVTTRLDLGGRGRHHCILVGFWF